MSFRWGIIGTGKIATKMADTFAEMDDAELVGVASRSPERAGEFAARNGCRAYPSIEEMVGSGAVDAVYVASTNDHHLDDTLAAIETGIPVLCEKSVAVDADDAAVMVERARSAGVFLMEAMWMRFQPFWETVDRVIGRGDIGEVLAVDAALGFVNKPDLASRLFDPLRGGGALLDLGIYPASFAYFVAGPVEAVSAEGVPAPTGVDGSVAFVFRHRDVVSSMSCSLLADLPNRAVISGSDGRLELDAPFHHTSRVTRWRSGRLLEEFDVSYPGSGYRFEVEEVHRCLRQGLTESPLHPLDDTLALMRLLDRIRLAAFG